MSNISKFFVKTSLYLAFLTMKQFNNMVRFLNLLILLWR